MDYSFYGGRRGAAFVITGRFRYIEAADITDRDMTLIKQEYGEDKTIKTLSDWEKIYCMKEAFNQGGNYTTVNYDEYVIIDSYNKNDPDNGKIYRRGYNYQDDLGGAQYQGQIVGPGGMAPAVEMSTYNDVKDKADEEGYEVRHTSGEYTPTNSLIPGKTSSGTFNDSIQWQCCSVRDEFNKDTTAYVGFIFPYTVIDYTVSTVSHYKSGTRSDTVDVQRTDDQTHPFYEKWNIAVPEGIKGDTFKNLRMITAGSETVYNADNSGIRTWTAIEINEQRRVLVYDYYHYDTYENGDKHTIYIGDYNRISTITVDTEDSTGEEGSGNQKIRVHFDDGTSYNIGQALNYIINTKITDDYHYIVLYSDPARRASIKAAGKNYPQTIDGHDDWADMGSIRSDSGLLIGYHYDTDIVPEMGNITTAIEYLNTNFPKGLTDTEVYGKIVTSGAAVENKYFFGFNYDYADTTKTTYKGWYFLGVFGDLQVVCGRTDDEATQAIAAALPTGGLWFVTEERTNGD